MNPLRPQRHLLWLFTLKLRTIQRHLVGPLTIPLLSVSIFAAPPKALKITQVDVTAETATSASVTWITNTASDSLLQYSTSNPVPAGATQVYVPTQVTFHEIPLAGLSPGAVYFYRVTSCAKRGCVTATGSFETSPSCPDVVPPLSGNWQKAFSANVGGTIPVGNQLLSVDAVSQNDVWAVGWSQDPNGPPYAKRTLIQHFDGSNWSIVGSPNPLNDIDSVLHAVSAVSANDVWAVGGTHNGKLPGRSLIEHWDGVQWKIVPSPSPDNQFNELRGVAALAANDVWAVGYRGGTKSTTPIETFVLHWDGSSWTQVASPNVSGGANQLFGITAIAANDMWAVGSFAGAPLAMHWNGNSWSISSLPVSSGLSTEFLNAVSGVAANDVWTVGQGKGIFSNQTFATIRHWDGVRWTEKICRAASASNPPAGYEGGGPDTYFTGVAAAASNDVWAVGVRGSGPIILHWDGQAWTEITHPRAFPNAAVLKGVATASGGSAWSVGLEIEVSPSGSASPPRTLVDKYTP
jgi:hypothetical protein